MPMAMTATSLPTNDLDGDGIDSCATRTGSTTSSMRAPSSRAPLSCRISLNSHWVDELMPLPIRGTVKLDEMRQLWIRATVSESDFKCEIPGVDAVAPTISRESS